MNWQIQLALWTSIVIWSGSFLATRWLVLEIPPLTAAGLRFSLAAVLLVALLWLRDGKFPGLPRALWPPALLYGFLGVTLCYALENIGLQYTSTGNASVLIGLIPAITVVLARVFLKERLLARQWFGVALASVGSFVLVALGGNIGLSDPLGDGLLLGTAVVSALAGLVGKRNTVRMDPLLNVAYGFAGGALLLLPLVVGEWVLVRPVWGLTWQGGLGLLYLVVFASVVAYSSFFWALSRTTLIAASIPTYSMPVLTMLLAALLLNETLTVERLIAAGVVILGLVFASELSIASLWKPRSPS